MRRIREILRLKFELGLHNGQIARSCNLPHSTVANYLRRAEAAGLAWPLRLCSPLGLAGGSQSALHYRCIQNPYPENPF
jgi:hypothetical protein